LRAGGGGDGAGRRGIPDGTGGEVQTPEEKLFKLDVRSDVRRSEWESYIDELRTRGFLDPQSRVLELLFTTYNVNSNLYCAVTIDITMPFTGGAFGAATFFTVEPVRHLTFMSTRGARLFPPPGRIDALKLGAEILFLLLLLRMLWREVQTGWRTISRIRRDASRMEAEARGTRLRSRASALLLATANVLMGVQLWSVMQLASLVLHLVVTVRRFNILNVLLDLDLAPGSSTFVEFHRVADDMYTTQNLLSLNVLFSFLSLFKFATVVPQLSMLNRTIATAFNDLAGFLFMFMIVFLGFMQAFQLSFGQDLREFASGEHSFYTLFAVLSGDVRAGSRRAGAALRRAPGDSFLRRLNGRAAG
jgi:hypothetical protein